MKNLLTLLFLTLTLPGFAQELVSNRQCDIVFRGVNVIPMDQERVIENQTVVVRNGRITAMGNVATVKFGNDALVVEATGKYLTPG